MRKGERETSPAVKEELCGKASFGLLRGLVTLFRLLAAPMLFALVSNFGFSSGRGGAGGFTGGLTSSFEVMVARISDIGSCWMGDVAGSEDGGVTKSFSSVDDPDPTGDGTSSMEVFLGC